MSIKQNFPTIKPTLNLDFANSRAVDSRITFTRASAATYTDAQGIQQINRDNKPRIDFDSNTGECRGLLIEESRANLMKCSDRISSYTNSVHGFTGSIVVPFATTAPDGTFSASSILETTATEKHCIQNGFTQGAAGYYTVSIFVKPNGRTKITFREEYSYGGDIDFDLSTQTATAGAGAWISNTGRVQSFTNGWYRISATINLSSANAYTVFDIIANSGSATSYAGDQSKGFYAWGFQIELGSFLTSYVPTTPTFSSRASSATYFDAAGVLRIAPTAAARYGYESPYKQVDFYPDAGLGIAGYSQTTAGTSGTLRSQGLILEPASTNLVTYSYNMSTANTGYYFTGAGSFVVTGETTAPDNTYTASKFVFTGANDRVDQGYGTVPSAGWYTLSVWLKGVAGTVVQVSILTSVGGNVEPPVYLTGQWQRFSVRKYFNSGETLRVHAPIIRGAMGNSVTAATGETGVYATYVYLWGLQIEAGQTPTSYIPTYGATATRAADVSSTATVTRAKDSAQLTGTNFSSWYNQLESTIYTEADILGVSASGSWAGDIYCFGSNGTEAISSGVSNTTPSVYAGRSAVGGITLFTATYNTPFKIAQSFNKSTTNHYASGNGAVAQGPVGYGVPYQDSLTIGDSPNVASRTLSGHIKKLTYYPKAVTTAQLQALTV